MKHAYSLKVLGNRVKYQMLLFVLYYIMFEQNKATLVLAGT